jgi:hypothetical protein
MPNLSDDKEEDLMEFPEVQPLLRISTILQWLVIVLIFFAGTLQIAKVLIDKRIDSARNQETLAKVEAYERTIADLRTKAQPMPEKKQVPVEPSKERRIPAHMLSQVKAELSSFDRVSVRLACDKNDKEALFFAEHLKSLFEDAGWAVAGINQIQHTKPLKEVVILLNHEEQKEKANYLFSLLMALGVKSSARLNRNQQEDWGIIIGQRE